MKQHSLMIEISFNKFTFWVKLWLYFHFSHQSNARNNAMPKLQTKVGKLGLKQLGQFVKIYRQSNPLSIGWFQERIQTWFHYHKPKSIKGPMKTWLNVK